VYLLLFLVGAGKYSLDAKLGWGKPAPAPKA
jgi:uncharacterized membrane protein YphA (DoxX/SURF4 family)